jgi:hypothetical protein
MGMKEEFDKGREWVATNLDMSTMVSSAWKVTRGSQRDVFYLGCSVADPDFYPSRILDLGSPIPDAGSETKERGEKISCHCHSFFCSHKFHIVENYFSFEMPKKKIWANFQRIPELFTLKLSLTLKNMDLGSESLDPEKTYSGSWIQWSKKHRIPDPNPQHCLAD